MAHFTLCILVCNDGNTDEQLLEKAVVAANKFNTELEVAPYKRYLEPDDVAHMKRHYKINNINELVTKLEDWNGESGGIDDRGLYTNSTRNPEGYFDYGQVLDKIPPHEWEHAFLGDRICKAVITPNGSWIDGPFVMFDANPESKRLLREWEKKLRSILRENAEATAFLADCHI